MLADCWHEKLTGYLTTNPGTLRLPEKIRNRGKLEGTTGDWLWLPASGGLTFKGVW